LKFVSKNRANLQIKSAFVTTFKWIFFVKIGILKKR